jgi:hypothetical protein
MVRMQKVARTRLAAAKPIASIISWSVTLAAFDLNVLFRHRRKLARCATASPFAAAISRKR